MQVRLYRRTTRGGSARGDRGAADEFETEAAGQLREEAEEQVSRSRDPTRGDRTCGTPSPAV